jgi:hypothetical protein
MKKLFNRLFYDLLINLKSYRKKLGGRWYYVRIKDSAYGVQGGTEYWTQKPEEEIDIIIIKEESH